MAMTQSEVRTSRMILYIEAIVALVYGLLFLLIPRWMFALSQDAGVPADPGWVRWSGRSRRCQSRDAEASRGPGSCYYAGRFVVALQLVQ
jgi:hypothetical protein